MKTQKAYLKTGSCEDDVSKLLHELAVEFRRLLRERNKRGQCLGA
jgi:hypothetical protein